MSIVYITTPDPVKPEPPLVRWVEFCKKIEPPPVYCKIPSSLKFKAMENSGTVQTYTITSSMMSGASGYGTSTTTTTP